LLFFGRFFIFIIGSNIFFEEKEVTISLGQFARKLKTHSNLILSSFCDKHKRAIFKFYIVHASKKTKSENNILFKLATDIVLRCYE
jgi:hypothetical protein